MTEHEHHPDDLSLDELAEMLEREAESLRDEANALRSQATTLDNRREQFVLDITEPIQRLREAAGLPPTAILAPPTRSRTSM